jgi:hypothetical protein
MTKRQIIVAVLFTLVPTFALAGAGVALDLGSGWSGFLAFAGSYLGSVTRDVLWLRRHERTCPSRKIGHDP